VAVTESAQRLWHALAMGPLWRERAPAGDPAAARVHGAALLDWDGLEQAVAGCASCGLSRTRTRTVFGAGSRRAGWMFIGEAPGAEEDARGEPFVGQAGRLLDNMLAEAGLGRDRAGAQAVYIANVIKCRPPGNRNPETAEVAACAPYLQRQIDLLQPHIIVVMGRFATQALLATDASIASLRGRVHEFVAGERRYPVIVTYHPAYLLRNLADKSRSWEDLCLAHATYAALVPAVSPESEDASTSPAR
jgi:uracil-DNA glycosylase